MGVIESDRAHIIMRATSVGQLQNAQSMALHGFPASMTVAAAAPIPWDLPTHPQL